MLIVATLLGALLGAGIALWLASRARRGPALGTSIAAPIAPVTPPFGDVLDRLRLGVVVADGTGRVQYRNASAGAMAGTHIGLLVDESVERQLGEARNGAPNRSSTATPAPTSCRRTRAHPAPSAASSARTSLPSPSSPSTLTTAGSPVANVASATNEDPPRSSNTRPTVTPHSRRASGA